MMTNYFQIKHDLEDYLRENLKQSRLEHTYRVAEEAVKLAKIWGEDPAKAELAALFHDAYRNINWGQLCEYVNRFGLEARYKDSINLAHSKIAAAAMREIWGIEDEDMINAVSYHTTGRAGMSLLEKIIFVADAAEPGRTYPGVDKIRGALGESIDRACLISLEGMMGFLEGQGASIDPDTISARDYLEEH